MSNFIEKCLRGELLLDDIDDCVEAWHECDIDIPLYKFLGMSKLEYGLWVSEPGVLPFVVDAHRQHRNIEEIISEDRAMPMAARAASSEKAANLIVWLKNKGYLE